MFADPRHTQRNNENTSTSRTRQASRFIQTVGRIIVSWAQIVTSDADLYTRKIYIDMIEHQSTAKNRGSPSLQILLGDWR